MRQSLISRAWRSRWTPMFVVLALIGCYIAYKRLVPPLDSLSTYELNGDLLVHGNPTLREVALTFDDGPYGETTEHILKTLEAEGVQATFFLVGKHIEQRPELVRRILTEGHEVGNHTYSHPRLTQITNDEAKQEMLRCEQAFFSATGAHMNLMRPPGMQFDDALLRLNQELGYTTIHWNALAGDYVPVEPGLITKRVLWQVQPGSVILLHDTPDTAKALPELIQRLKAQGYRFVTVTQMLARLPRPVFLASNAGMVDWEETAPPVKSSPRPVRKPAPKKKTSPPTSTRPIVDVPTWDGPTEEDDVQAIA